MRYTNSKKFVKSNSSEGNSLITIAGDTERDDDDPLSIRDTSTFFLGLLVASLTILLPLISVLLSRPLSHVNETNSFHTIKEDGP